MMWSLVTVASKHLEGMPSVRPLHPRKAIAVCRWVVMVARSLPVLPNPTGTAPAQTTQKKNPFIYTEVQASKVWTHHLVNT